MADITLSTVSPDHADIVAQLQAALTTRDAWKDRLTTSTGQTLVEFIAAVGAYDQYAIESAFQEVFPESAKNKDSIYAAAEFMGVRTNRKIGANVQVLLSAPAPVTIPAYSQFTGGGTYWYNRVPITVNFAPATFDLYQGKPVIVTTSGLGTDFQSYVTEERDFVVADQDVLVKINGINQYVTTDGLWTRPNQDGIQNKTLPDGKMLLLFGNTIYGSRPSSTDTIEITYVVTQGGDSNNLPVLGRPVAADAFSTVVGNFVSAPSGGSEQSPFLVYKNITPALFGSFNSSVTAAQYKRLPLQYPGVIDAVTFAQREINPRALAWMNVVKVCLLTASPLTGPQWALFEDFYQRNTMYSTRIYREDPVAVNVNVAATVYCANFANLNDIRAKVEAALDALFQPRQGILGLDVYLSDIYNAIQDADANIKYVQLDNPTTDLVLSSLNVPAPTASVFTGVGTLGPGTYDYAIAAVSTLGGETAPAFWTTVVTTAALNRIELAWQPVANALSYKVYGRVTPSSLGLIATVPGNVLTYDDTGAVAPSGTVPNQSTVAIYYPRLLTKTITMEYSTRPNEIA